LGVKEVPDSRPDSPPPAPPETIDIAGDADEVCCDGGGGALGHPRVWYSFDGRKQVRCHYCDRAFIKKAKSA
jgi:uncharacterized Zn-finger protein